MKRAKKKNGGGHEARPPFSFLLLLFLCFFFRLEFFAIKKSTVQHTVAKYLDDQGRRTLCPVSFPLARERTRGAVRPPKARKPEREN